MSALHMLKADLKQNGFGYLYSNIEAARRWTKHEPRPCRVIVREEHCGLLTYIPFRIVTLTEDGEHIGDQLYYGPVAYLLAYLRT